MATGVRLILRWQLRPFRQGGIEDRRVRARDQYASRVSGGVAHDLSAEWVRRILGIANDPQGGAVEECAIIEMQNEDGRVWGSLIQLLQSWHPAFGELEFRPPAHHADPLPRRRSLRLLLQHPQTVGERGNAIPAKFQVVIEPAADQVRM